MSKKIEGIEGKEIEKAPVEKVEKKEVVNGIRIKIPEDALNPKDKEISVTINGKNTIYERGKTYTIDNVTVQVLENAGII